MEGREWKGRMRKGERRRGKEVMLMFVHCVCEVCYYNYDSTILLKNLKNNTQNTAITNSLQFFTIL